MLALIMKHKAIKYLLPEVIQRTDQPDSPLFAVLEVMEALTEPSEDCLNRLADFFTPYTTSEQFLPFLASWLDLDRFFANAQLQESFLSIDSGRLRELIAAATHLSQMRGTVSGLQLFLETATGITGFKITENVLPDSDDVIPFHVHVYAPSAAKPKNALIERIIEQEKPAYVTYRLEYLS